MNKKWNTEAEARAEILGAVADYYKQYKSEKKAFEPGDRITYAARVFDEKEMCSLVDASLDFWLTTGRFADQFEREFAKWLGVRFASHHRSRRLSYDGYACYSVWRGAGVCRCNNPTVQY